MALALSDITTKPFILALFKRDDGERFLLGSGAYEFKHSQMHFSANAIVNDAIDTQGSDGSFLAGQVRRSSTQSFDGYVGDGTTTQDAIEGFRIDFLAYFQKDHFYTVVYIFSDGSAIQRQRGYLVDAPEIKELYQASPEYHVALTFEDVNYYKYAEDDDGNEAFSNTAVILSSYRISGGVVWDEVGAVWDKVGLEWETGRGGGPTFVTVGSIQNVLPTITIVGPASSPTLVNATTGQTLKYSGNVTDTQTLIINVNEKTAKLNGAPVLQNVSGDWLELAPGVNHLTYSTQDADIKEATIAWQEVVG